jgi:hypothetical protein
MFVAAAIAATTFFRQNDSLELIAVSAYTYCKGYLGRWVEQMFEHLFTFFFPCVQVSNQEAFVRGRTQKQDSTLRAGYNPAINFRASSTSGSAQLSSFRTHSAS